MREQVTHIEQCPADAAGRARPRSCRVKISEADDGHFGEPEFFLDARRYRLTAGS